MTTVTWKHYEIEAEAEQGDPRDEPEGFRVAGGVCQDCGARLCHKEFERIENDEAFQQAALEAWREDGQESRADAAYDQARDAEMEAGQ